MPKVTGVTTQWTRCRQALCERSCCGVSRASRTGESVEQEFHSHFPESSSSGTVFLEELPAVLHLSKCLRTPGTRGGKRACQVSGRKAYGQISTPHILMKKARVKAVARAHGVDRLDN